MESKSNQWVFWDVTGFNASFANVSSFSQVFGVGCTGDLHNLIGSSNGIQSINKLHYVSFIVDDMSYVLHHVLSNYVRF